MIEVAIASVNAVFDWKAYLKEEFGYEVDESWLMEDEQPEDFDEDEDEDGAGDASDGKETKTGEPALQ